MRKAFFLSIALFIFTLSAFGQENAQQSNKMTKLVNAELSVCDYIVQQANEGKLEKILISSSTLSDQEPLPDEIADAARWGSTEKYKIDINNDGKQEQVYVTYQGSLHLSSLYVFPLNEQNAKTIQINFKYDNKSYDEENLSSSELVFFQYEGKIYMLTKSGNSLDALFFIDSENQGVPVCWFGQKAKPQQSLVQSMNKDLCNAAIKGKLQYVEFEEEPELEEGEKLQEGMYIVYPDSDAALIDVDNDGRKEFIIHQDNEANCMRYILVALTPDEKKINKQLSDLLPQGGCGTEVKPLIYKGKTYLDVIGYTPQSEYRQIFLLQKKSIQEVCNFKVIPLNYVLNPVEIIKKVAGNAGIEDVWEYAISQPGTNAVDTLIKGGEDINKTANSSPLMIALRNKRTDIMEMLLKAGADPNMRIKDSLAEWPLESAVIENMPEAVQLLLKYGAEKNSIVCSNSFMWATDKDSMEMLNVLLDNGIPIPDDRVAEAVRNGKHKALKRLIERGLIDLNRKYTEETPGGIDIKKEAPGILSIKPNANTKPVKVTKTLLEFAINTVDIETLLTLKEEKTKQEGKCHPHDKNTFMNQAYLMPEESVCGLSQGEWSWRYWEWSKSFPKEQNPADDQTGSICMKNQSGTVFMLTGSSKGKPVTRSGEVPSGKYIFIPVLVSLAEDKQFNCKSLTSAIDKMSEEISSLYVEIDHQKITDMKSFRQKIGCYLLDTYSGKNFAASDGYWVMLKPLALGKHSIRFGGRFSDGFSQDVLYELTVK